MIDFLKLVICYLLIETMFSYMFLFQNEHIFVFK